MSAEPKASRVRLDELLVERGFFVTRSRARDAILRGAVAIDGDVVTKPGRDVPVSAELSIDDPARGYVSRAALKLVTGLDRFGLDPRGKAALDLGASTGGFTQVLLERGANHVVAVDVGHGQMDDKIKHDPRVTSIEGLNARQLTIADLQGAAPEFVVSDLSFISLRLAAAPALELAAPGAECLLLVKPQFEAGRQAIGKGGLLMDTSQAPVIAASLRDWLGTISGWRALGFAPSPIQGGDGNVEFLLAGRKDR